MDIPSYQSGYADAKAGKASLYPVVVAPPPPVIITPPSVLGVRLIGVTENWQNVIDTAPATQTQFSLSPKAAYKGVGNWIPKRGNWTLDGQGASIVFTEPAGASSIIRVGASTPDVNFKNMTVSVAVAGNFDMFRFQAPVCSAINVTLTGPTIATFGMADIGGTHALFQGCTIPLTNSVSIYMTEDDAQASGNTLVGSVGETVMRVDNPAPSATLRLPNRVIITGNTFFTVGGKNEKGAVEWRNAGTGCVFQDNTMHDYVRVGQDGMTAASQSISGIQILGNTFIGQGPLPVNLMLKNGIVLIGVTSNKFSVVHPIDISGPSQVTFNPPTTAAEALYNKANVTANAAITGGF